MIWRLSGRRAFAELRARGARVRRGNLWSTYVLDPTASPPRVAFAIGRACGSAVQRNRLRRRLRALLADGSPLPPGRYLIGAQPAAATQSFAALTADLHSLRQRWTQAAADCSSG